MCKIMQNKWVRAAIPALLIQCSIGTVYCWSLISETIVDYIGNGVTKGTIEWAFSLAIFFLGMSAAFLGPMVERDVHKSSLISTICFTVGMAGTGFAISAKSVIGIYIFYGVIMGVGLGIGYLCPVKTLMLWFHEQKGLATGLAIAGFGLAKVIGSPIMEYLQTQIGIVAMFYVLAGVYFVLMFIGHLLLAKPKDWIEQPVPKKRHFFSIFKNKTFVGIWIMFFCNITAGLALISQEKSIIKALGLVSLVGVVSSLTAVFNAGGRIGFSTWADHLKDRNTVYKIIFVLSICFTGAAILVGGIINGYAFILIPLLFVINAGYGGGFSNVPALLSDHFGMNTISQIHGLVLTAWAFAGPAGNQVATYIVNHTGKFTKDAQGNMINPIGYQNVLYFIIVLYAISLFCSIFVVGSVKKKKS